MAMGALLLEKDGLQPPATIPTELKCPLTLEIFRHPVQADDGRIYERERIEAHIANKVAHYEAIDLWGQLVYLCSH